ncbi:MAG: purine-nucleoside phosphorylase [Melioribacteraceae bacterium]|nr:purine-nucleoside phosphorylase [Melioribacteraceae bacterium]
MINIEDKYKELTDSLNEQIPFYPEIALILGSGLGEFAEKVNTIKTIPTNELPNYPHSTVEGHKGFIHFAELFNKKLLIYQGRIHPYEGYNISECVLPIHIAHKLNVKKVILTNAAGGLNHLKPADLMLITSMNTFNIKKELTELIGLASLEMRNRFLDFPSEHLNKIIRSAALKEEVPLKEGVYWFGMGPSYETPAEIKMVEKLGGDAVGMSTVHEAVYASALGMEVGAISCITNYAAGISPNKLNHKEVMETAELVKGKFERLIKKIIKLL